MNERSVCLSYPLTGYFNDLGAATIWKSAYGTQDFVNETRAMKVTLHVAQNDSRRRSAIDVRVTRHAGYAVNQTIRKRIEEAFGCGKQVRRMRRTLFRGLPRVGLSCASAAAAYNLVRLPQLIAT